jgi:hypothetical protein
MSLGSPCRMLVSIKNHLWLQIFVKNESSRKMLHLPMMRETDPLSETLCSGKSKMLDKVRNDTQV